MSKPGEHKTVQVRILAYAQEIGWGFVPCAKAEGTLVGEFQRLNADIANNRELLAYLCVQENAAKKPGYAIVVQQFEPLPPRATVQTKRLTSCR